MTSFIRIWILLVLFLNCAGIAGFIVAAPDGATAWRNIAETYSPFNVLTHALNLILLTPALVALWIRERRNNRSTGE